MTQVQPFVSPLYYDKVAQELNAKLALLSHIDDLYGVVWVGYDDEETFPEIYVNDGTKLNLRVMPDSTKSLSFFVVTDQISEVDEILSAIPMAYCVWMNLAKVDPSKAYDFTTEIIRDCYNVINTYGGYDVSIEVNDPYPEFSQLSKQVAANIMRPYSGFRIEFTKNVNTCNW